MHFSITQWRAWAPGLESLHDWQAWARQPWRPAAGAAQPDVAFLPALQRRRLSRLARMAFSVAWPLAESRVGQPQLPLVFASRHGETPRTFALLSDLAEQTPLSPTQFSLSVHNAIIGLWSILRGDTSEMTALAAEGDGLEHAILEAGMLLTAGAPAVLVVIAEDLPPAAYAPWIDDVPFPYAVGLLLTPGTDWQLSLGENTAPAATAEWPHALSLLHTLLSHHSHCQHHWKSRAWTWQHKP
ncbi:beta-ketoacyl synthase chain length factor [Pseudomonas sp. 2FE]|uniref:beta-ketoacyl synthase chain length factor n=1 Tax=Pseudomonas sp. 2FE TaxID=2502190 RepID=UPI0010F94EAE|nr:beta-ketoacyl synthase chain length factor [Pseudomonas sp. 2FE]